MTLLTGERLVGLSFAVPLIGTVAAFAFVHKAAALRSIVVLVALVQCAIAVGMVLALEEVETIVLSAGDWPIPMGIRLVADKAGVLALAVGSLVMLAAALYTPSPDPASRRGRNDHLALIPPLALGASGLALSADLFNLYVWFEVLLAGSFALLAYRGGPKQLRASLFYVSINLFASSFYLIAVAILYARFGTLDLGHLSEMMSDGRSRQTVDYVWGFLLVFFGVKVAAFPFFAWLPRAYPTATISVMALFSGLLTKLAFFALLRLWVTMTPSPLFGHILLWVGALTVFCGTAAAAMERRSRRFVAWLLAGEMGYLLLAIAYGSNDGLAASLFLLAHMAVAVTTLLLAIGLMESRGCPLDLDGGGGNLWRESPSILVVFGVASLGLAGLPPLTGFIGKLALLRSALERESWIGVGVVLLSSLVAIAVLAAFWLKAAAARESVSPSSDDGKVGLSLGRAASLALLLAAQAAIVIKANWVYGYCEQAAATLMSWPGLSGRDVGG